MTETNLPKMLTVPEVRDVLRLKDDKGVIRLINSGELPAVKPNRAWLVREDDLDAFLRGEKLSDAEAVS